VNRIHHTFDKWECYPGGMYETTAPGKMTAREANDAYAVFLRDVLLFERELERLLTEWPNSCEHYLSNEKMNRIAWLGQAAVCIHCRIPRGFRGGFNLLSPEEQRAANDAALKWLNVWLVRRGEPEVTMEGAGISTEADRY
jgi:hypothetical protein